MNSFQATTFALLLGVGGCAVEPRDDDSGRYDDTQDALTNRVEAEAQAWTSSSGDSTSASSSTLRLNANASGDSFKFTTTVATGNYSVTVRLAQRNIYGNYQVYVNGKSVGTITGYSSNTSDTWTTVSLGTLALSGAVEFKFTSTGKNSAASDFDIKLDYLELTTTSGGTPSTGGASSTGGTTAKGGASSTGGTTAKGGTSSTGGTTAKGGTTSTSNNGSCTIPTPSSTPIGYGASVTGGGNKTPVEVSSQAALVTALAAYKNGTSGLVLKYTGTFNYSSIAANPCAQFTKAAQVVDIKDMSNLTIIGAPGSAINFGLHFVRVNNVSVRNMTIGYVPGSADAIGIEGASYNLWFDHNEIFSSMAECDGAGDLEFDGALDIKAGSHNMTFSYNYFHDHHKVGLMGSSDSDTNDWRVTLHHNRYENIGSRLPLQRGGTTHIYNNYYNKIIVSGINVRMGGVSLIESNYFENSKNPVTSRDSDAIGYWDLRNNYVGSGITWVASSSSPSANATNWTTTKSVGSLGYSYAPDSAACIKQIVTATAGAKL